MDVEDFNPEARRAVLWTREHISPENLAWLSDLPSQPLVQDDFTLTHGSPRDPVWEYVLYPVHRRGQLQPFRRPVLPRRPHAYPRALRAAHER